jgi:hypothetical protein
MRTQISVEIRQYGEHVLFVDRFSDGFDVSFSLFPLCVDVNHTVFIYNIVMNRAHYYTYLDAQLIEELNYKITN